VRVSRGIGPPIAFTLQVTCWTFALSQCCSLLLRRGLYALCAAGLLVPLAMLWLVACLALAIPGLFATVVPVVLLFALSLWQTRAWLLERTGLQQGTKAALGGLGVLSATLAGAIAYRVFAVPGSANSHDLAALRPSEAALAAGKTYRDLARQIVPMPLDHTSSEKPGKYWADGWQYSTPADRAWLASQQDLLEQVLRATQADECAMADFWSEPVERTNVWPVPLLRIEAVRREAQGDLDSAWEMHLAQARLARQLAQHADIGTRELAARVPNYRGLWRWAARREQSGRTLLRASRELVQEWKRFPKLAGSVRLQAALAIHDVDELDAERWDYLENGSFVLMRKLPWERARAKRLIRALADHDLAVANRNSETSYDESRFKKLTRTTPHVLASTLARELTTMSDALQSERTRLREHQRILATFAIYAYRAAERRFPDTWKDVRRDQTAARILQLAEGVIPGADIEPSPGELAAEHAARFGGDRGYSVESE
jgi:hypothetical protein